MALHIAAHSLSESREIGLLFMKEMNLLPRMYEILYREEFDKKIAELCMWNLGHLARTELLDEIM